MFLKESQLLINKLKKLSSKKVSTLMNLSKKLADLNVERYQLWNTPFTKENSKQAFFAFNGEVYNGLNAETLTKEDVEFAQDNLRILSGLHGVLRPLDLIQPYRLEMGTKIGAGRAKTLYEYWTKKVTAQLLDELPKDEALINLASNEYYKVIDQTKFKRRIITPVFKDEKNGNYKVLTIYAKHARGMMTRFIIQNKIKNPEEIKAFDEKGYVFNPNLTNGDEWVFTRG
jgi:cytoplasmic iron level regulating protein YaaA (DUF328/UPF0246 family)